MPDLLRRHLLWTGALAPLALALPSPARTQVPPAPAGLSAGSTAEQATAGLDLRGRTIPVTGCNSGIGLETMRVLALRGAHVIGTARTSDKGKAACASVSGRAGGAGQAADARGERDPAGCRRDAVC